MNLIMETIFETEWGAIIVGVCIFIALIIYFFDNKTPKT